MIFGKMNTLETSDCILAHSLRMSDGRIRKGTVLNASHIEQLVANGIDEVTVAKLEAGDVHEDEAARLLAESLLGEGIRLGRATTGRVNCYAETAGLLTVPKDRLLAINNITETITASTLSENRWVEAGKMVATIKIISYSVTRCDLDSAIHACCAPATAPSPSSASESELSPLTPPLLPLETSLGHTRPSEETLLTKLCVHQAKPRSAYLLQTTMKDMSPAIIDKTERVTNRRLSLRQVQLLDASTCPHDVDALAARLAALAQKNSTRIDSGTDNSHSNSNWILISGASAISDRQDVIPQAVEQAGGTVTRCGIPVDPGNLLMLGHIKTSTVIGIPGCARSPKHNGLDLFMDRLSCNLPIS